jgi:hypothetical protein
MSIRKKIVLAISLDADYVSSGKPVTAPNGEL